MTATVTPLDSRRQQRHQRTIWRLGYGAIVGTGLVVALFARRRIDEPYLGLTLAIFMVLLVGWIFRPRSTLYSILFLTAVSDINTVWWFPFTKNLSSRESISFVADALTVSPLEISLYLGAAISMVRRYARTRTLVEPTAVNRVLLVFTAMVGWGFIRGQFNSGDLRIAVLEGRALLYIPLAFVIIVNECRDGAHLRYALIAFLAGVVTQSLLSIQYLTGLDPAARDSLERLNEHGSAVGHDLLIVTLLVLALLGGRERLAKWILLVAAVPTVYVFFVGQRRSGVAVLVIACALIAIALYWRRRALFWMVVPASAAVIALYVLAFWNSTSSLGFPAQAIKSVIAPASATPEDISSDLYRRVEAFNLVYTIRTDPLLGLGFGRPFYRPVWLPGLDAFALNLYLPHNSWLWLWIKTGFVGFVAAIYLFGKSIMLGAHRVRNEPDTTDLVVTLAGTAFVAMYFAFCFVDVSWDARNNVFLAVALAICVRPVAAHRAATTEAGVGSDIEKQSEMSPSLGSGID